MKAPLTMTAIALCNSVVMGSELPRSSPESQGVSSAALLAFVEAADKNIDSLHSFMLVRHGHVVAEGWWSPYHAEAPHSLYSLSKSFTSTAVGLAVAEGKLSARRRGAEVLSRGCPGRAERQPQGDAGQRPAPHVDGPSDRAAAHAG